MIKGNKHDLTNVIAKYIKRLSILSQMYKDFIKIKCTVSSHFYKRLQMLTYSFRGISPAGDFPGRQL